MKLYKVRICGTSSEFKGIQGFLRNDQRSLTLNMIGESSNCEEIPIEDDVFVEKIQTTYDSSGINYFSLRLSNGTEESRGQPSSLDKEFLSEFTEHQRIAGFVGYKKGGITALGAYRYMCNEPPPTDPTDPQEDDPETDDDQTDPIYDPELDYQFDSDFNKDDDEPQIIQVTQEDSHGMTLVLILLLCILVPLIGTLCYIVHLFRKNKVNAVAAAMGRRRSSVNLKANYQKRDSLRRSVALDDDKIEG